MLEVSGLVTLKKGATGGAFLNDSNSAALSQNLIDGIALRQYSVKELIDVRMALEHFIAVQACENASDDEIEQLAALAEASRKAEVEVPDYENRLTLHMEFHRKLSEMAHNGVAEALMGALLGITRQFHLETGPTGGPETHETREELVQALRERHPEAAKQALTKHFEALQSRMLVAFPD